jgi:TrmH family RNA methyltransferase
LLNPSDLNRICIVLVSARNPLNIGAAARAMSNFGFLQLRVVNPYQVAFRQARSAVGASELMAKAQEFQTLAEAIADCTLVVGTTVGGSRELHHPLRRLEQGARLIRAQSRSDRVALLFGSEKFGLSNQDLSHCHWLMRIPTRAQHASMNLGQAVAVCLYELIRDARKQTNAQTESQADSRSERHSEERATAAEIERLSVLLLEVLRDSGFIARHSANTADEKARRLVRRLQLPSRDAHVWMGIFRQIAWKQKNPSQPEKQVKNANTKRSAARKKRTKGTQRHK